MAGGREEQASLKLLYRQVKRLVAHIWPRKGKGSVTFGFDDPYTTGQVLQAVSLIYPFFHKQLAVYLCLMTRYWMQRVVLRAGYVWPILCGWHFRCSWINIPAG